MKIEFDLPEGIRLCSFAYETITGSHRFKAVVAGEAITGLDGIVRPHAIETARGETPQEAIDNAIECLRTREEALRNRVAPTPQPGYNKRTTSTDLNIELDLSGLF